MENKKKSLFEKIKKIKHFEIVIIIAFLAVLFLIYFSSFSGNSTKVKTTEKTLTTEEYSKYLEDKLCTILSSIKGAGNVECMIVLDGTISYVYATDVEEVSTTSTVSGTTTTKTTKTEDIIFVNKSGTQTPILLEEIMPKAKSVVIVCSGAENIAVRLKLQDAASAVLEIEQSKIEILIGE